MSRINRIGLKFNRLKILKEMPDIILPNGRRQRRCLAKCECGAVKEMFLNGIVCGQIRSCGCLQKEIASKLKTRETHGLTYHQLYGVYKSIITRCYYTKAVNYERYGGKGVRVCVAWKNDFKKFFDWAIGNGWEPGLQIDKDAKGNGLLYSPRWCSVLTKSDNCDYKSNTVTVEVEGVKMNLRKACGILNVNYKNIHWRMKNLKLSFREAINKKTRKKHLKQQHETNFPVHHNVQ